MDDAHHIHCTNGTGFWTYMVQVTYHLFFVGDCHVESHQVGVRGENFRKQFYLRNLEVHIFRVNPFVLEFLVEISNGEGVGERVTDETVFFHIYPCLGLFSCEVHCTDAKCHALERGVPESCFLQDVHHCFPLGKCLDCGCQIAVGALVFGY